MSVTLSNLRFLAFSYMMSVTLSDPTLVTVSYFVAGTVFNPLILILLLILCCFLFLMKWWVLLLILYTCVIYCFEFCVSYCFLPGWLLFLRARLLFLILCWLQFFPYVVCYFLSLVGYCYYPVSVFLNLVLVTVSDLVGYCF